MKRAGFTMIELIFVIVILGILAAVAIPRLSQSKADAENAANAQDYQTCLQGLRIAYFDGNVTGSTTATTIRTFPGCSLVTAYSASGIQWDSNTTNIPLN